MERDTSAATRILLAEDSDRDAELVLHELKRAGVKFESRRVQTEADLRRALDEFRPQLILSDYVMPGFSGLAALRICREAGIDIPFIFVSGTIGEDVAIESMKAGADDYVMKTNLIRLGPTVVRALRETELRQGGRVTEAALLRAQTMAKLAHVIVGPDEAFESWSETFPALLGVTAADVPRSTSAWLDLVHPEDRTNVRAIVIDGGRTGKRVEFEYRLKGAGGSWIHISQVSEQLGGAADASGRKRWFGTLQDVSEQKRAAEAQRSTLQLLDNIVENIPTAVQLKSVEDGFRVVMWNKAAEQMYGVPRQEAIGRNVHDLWPKPDADRFHAADLDLIAGGRMQDFPDRPAQTRERGEIRVHMRKVALFDRAGKPTHLLVIADDITEQLADQARLRESEERFRSLSQLSSDWFWQQDEEFRFVEFTGGDSPSGWGPDQNSALGKRRWELPGVTPLSGSWDEHKALHEAHLPFRNFEYQHARTDGTTKYISASGEPMFDTEGRYTGYRGVATEISERKRTERNLQRFRISMDVSPDSIYLTDPATMRFFYVNDAAAARLGHTREQVLQMSPADFLPGGRDQIRSDYEAVIAAGEQGQIRERTFVRSDGTVGWTELHRRALQTDDGQLIVTIGRDITERKRAQSVLALEHGVGRKLAEADNATDGLQAAMRLVCESEGWDFGRYWRVDQAAGVLRFADAWSKPNADGGGVTEASREVTFARGVGLAGKVWQSGEPLWVSNVGEDARVQRKDLARAAGMRGAFVFPVVAEGTIIGVLAFSSREIRQPDERLLAAVRVIGGQIGQFLRRMDANERIRRLSRVHAVLSGINALIVRVSDHNELFREACRIAVEAGNFSAAWMGVLDRATMEMIPAASHGMPDSYMETIRGSLSRVRSGGGGIAGEAVREKRSAMSNDIANDPRVLIAKLTLAIGTRALAVLPCMVAGEVVAVLSLHARELGFFDDEEMKLLQDLAENIAFALDNLEKADRLKFETVERSRAEAKVVRLSRVHAVLSGINAAIVRVTTKEELFKEACRIACSQGGFPVAWIGEVDRQAMLVRPVAGQGTDQGFLAQIRMTIREDSPEGLGVVGQAIRDRAPVISNDVAHDPRITAKRFVEGDTRSLAVLPLVVGSEARGVLILHAEVAGFFDEEELKLLRELAGDIAFAIDHLEKAGRLDYLAYYDQLTGLANRTLFLERVNQSIIAAGQAETKFALAILDLERLRTINDSLGRQAGDALIKLVAERLTLAGGPAGASRISADHFALVLGTVKGRSEAARIMADALRKCFDAPFLVNGTEVRISAKAGVAQFPGDATEAEMLLRNAEAALRRGKEGGERITFHSAEMTSRIAESLTLENKLRQALEKEEFVLHYQPKVDLDTRRIVGVEALIRWQSPERGLVPPMQFIPLLEETGLILQVGTWALKRATRDHALWLEQGLPAPRIAVNVSAIQLRQRDFVQVVTEAIAGGAKPTAVDIEITESQLMENITGNIEKLKALRDLGMKISIDDFGTGYSSLGYLASLPVHILKIDRSFIVAMLKNPDTMTLVSTIISLAHSLRLDVVAEGVEQEDQAKMLRLLRCDQMQGYLISKPVPMDAMTAMLKKAGASAIVS